MNPIVCPGKPNWQPRQAIGGCLLTPLIAGIAVDAAAAEINVNKQIIIVHHATV